MSLAMRWAAPRSRGSSWCAPRASAAAAAWAPIPRAPPPCQSRHTLFPPRVAMGATAQPRVILVRAARERGGGGLGPHPACPQPQSGVSLRGPLKLHQERGIVVSRQQPKQEAIGKSERTPVGRPAKLEQASVLKDRARFLPAHRLRRTGGEKISTPQPGVLLLPEDRQGFLVTHDLFAQLHDAVRVARGLRHDLHERPNLDR